MTSISQEELRKQRIRALDRNSQEEDNEEEIVQQPWEIVNNPEDIDNIESILKPALLEIWGILWSQDAPEDDRTRWYRQGFVFCEEPCFGLQQGDGGPCGVLATVQAEILRCILFGSRVDGDIDEELVKGKEYNDQSDLPTPTESELQIYLGEALLTILDRARDNREKPLIIVTSNQTPCTLENILNLSIETTDEVSATFSMKKFDEPDDEARCFIASILPQFTAPSGVVIFLMSLLLTRGLETIREDMDDNTATLIGQFGHCSQELMNLCLCGKASSNVFDGTVPMGDSGLTLKGIASQNPVGYLSHLEALRYCQVGSFYKTPLDPIWLIGSTSHFTVLFSQHRSAISESSSEVIFSSVSRAFKAFDPDENGYIPKASLTSVLSTLAESSSLLPANILEANSISALTASIETAGADIILWDDLWRSVSRLMSGGTLEAVLQSHGQTNTATSTSTSNTATATTTTMTGSVVDLTSQPTQSQEGASTLNRPRSDSEELAAAIAASLGQAPAEETPRPATPPPPLVSAEPQTEEEQMAMAIAASLGNVNDQTPATPTPTMQPTPDPAPASTPNRPRSDSEELAAAIAASLEPPASTTTEASSSSSTTVSGGAEEPHHGTSSSGHQIRREDSIADENGERLCFYHYNGMKRSGTGAPRLVKFNIIKRGDEEMVGVAVPLGASGGTGNIGLDSDYPIEDVLRTRWPGARIDWINQTPPSID